MDSNDRYFQSAYRDYESQNPPRKLAHYVRQVEIRAPAGPVSLLDLGCGLGMFLESLSRSHPDWGLFALDPSDAAVAASRERVPGALVVRASAHRQAFRDDSFDVVTAWDVLEHVLDIDAVATSVAKMLRPGGAFIFVVPVYDGLTGRIVQRLDNDPTHVHRASRDQWIEWAARHFDLVEWHGLVRYLIGPASIHMSSSRARRQTPAILVSVRSG